MAELTEQQKNEYEEIFDKANFYQAARQFERYQTNLEVLMVFLKDAFVRLGIGVPEVLDTMEANARKTVAGRTTGKV